MSAHEWSIFGHFVLGLGIGSAALVVGWVVAAEILRRRERITVAELERRLHHDRMEMLRDMIRETNEGHQRRWEASGRRMKHGQRVYLKHHR